MALQDKYKQKLLEIINSYIPNCSIYLFGSRAVDKEFAGSDIDLAIDAGEETSHNIILKILNEIEETNIPMEIDLVDLQSVSDKLKNDILTKRVVWKEYNKNMKI